MKKLILVLCSLTVSLCAQTNLVPNPSFENYSQCPFTINQAITTVSWTSTGGTSDYFNTCANGNAASVSVPLNFAGNQLPATGNAYCGFAAYIANNQGQNIREYIGTKLISPLVPGTTYKVSMKVALAEGRDFNFKLACNKIGARFSTYALPYLSSPIVFNNAHVFSQTIISDTVNWTAITGTLVADSAYTWIMCGNFFNNAQTSTISLGSPAVQAYYYIDDVSVTKDTIIVKDTVKVTTGLRAGAQLEDLLIVPNPACSNIRIQGLDGISRIRLVNCQGQEVWRAENFVDEYIDIGQLPEGLYQVEMLRAEVVITRRLVIRRE